MTVNSTQSGDTRRKERRLEKHWHGTQKRPKEKASRLATQADVKLDCEFDNPIGILRDCHHKIKRSLHVLWVIADRAGGRELTAEETAAVQSAIDCLRVDGARHTADEEQSLFPRLRAETITGDSEELNVLEDNRRQADPVPRKNSIREHEGRFLTVKVGLRSSDEELWKVCCAGQGSAESAQNSLGQPGEHTTTLASWRRKYLLLAEG